MIFNKFILNYFSIRRFLIRTGIDFSEDELSAAFKRLDIDRDSRVTFTEFKRLFTAATGGSFTSNSNPSNLNNLLKSSASNNLLNSFASKFDINNNAEKHSYRSLLGKNHLKASLRSASKTPKKEPSHFAANRDKWHSIEKTESILNKSAERFSRSPYRKYAEMINSKARNNFRGNEKNQNEEINENYNYKEKINNVLLNNDNEIKTNNCLFSSSLKSSSNNNFNNSTNAFSNANKLSGSNFSMSSNRAEFNSIVGYEEENFNYYLKELLQLENEIESAKSDLIIKDDFNIEDAFKIFELSGKGYLTELDIKYGMNSLDIYPSKEEMKLLVERYDMTKEGILKYFAINFF
jgi:Ca2+-binding EF-hand superfamily protein